MDRRAVFFFAAAWVCRELVNHTPSELRYVGNILSVWLIVLGVLSWFDHISRRRMRSR